MAHRVTGNGLVTLAKEFSGTNNPFPITLKAIAAGYYSHKPDGSIRIHYTDYFCALIQAKKDLGIWEEPSPRAR